MRWLEADGGPREFQAVGRDVTELKRLRAELDRANELANYAALAEERLRISHDLHDTFVHTLVATLSRLVAVAPRRAGGRAEGRHPGGRTRNPRGAAGRPRGGRRGALRTRFSRRPRSAAARSRRGAARQDARRASTSRRTSATSVRCAPATIVRIGREALRNIERHSGAREARVALRRSGAEVVLEIVDDGIGFQADAALPGITASPACASRQDLPAAGSKSRLFRGKWDSLDF